MIETKLLTRDGEYVTTVRVLPFTPMPEVIQWGERYFVRQGDDNGHDTPEYREGMLWPAIRLPDEMQPGANSVWQDAR